MIISIILENLYNKGKNIRRLVGQSFFYPSYRPVNLGKYRLKLTIKGQRKIKD